MTLEKEEKPVIDASEDIQEPKSLREEITDNLKAIKERDDDKDSPEKVADKPEKPVKQAKGAPEGNRPSKLVQGKLPAANPDKAEKPVIEAKPAIAAPESWKLELKSKWSTIPAEIQAEIARRETEMEKRVTTMDEERHFARKIKDVVTPYMPTITAEGGTPEGAVKDLLNTAYLLRTGTPQQKLNLIVNTARQFGVDLKNISQASVQNPAPDPIAIAREEVKTQFETYKQQQEMTQIQTVIDAFASDPANVHYQKVKPVMAALLTAGTAKDMKDAYDRACHADPDIRAQLQAEKSRAEEQERIAEKKARTEKARYAASSVKGSSPLNGADLGKPPKRGLREELQANYRAATEH